MNAFEKELEIVRSLILEDGNHELSKHELSNEGLTKLLFADYGYALEDLLKNKIKYKLVEEDIRGIGSNISTIISLNDKFFKLDGTNISHYGTEYYYDSSYVREVVQKEVTEVKWVNK